MSAPLADGTLLLTRSDVASLLSLDACIGAVEEALRLHAEGRTLPPGVLGVPAAGGGFHIKAAGLRLDRTWFAVKCNGNFPANAERFGMPTIQGIVILCDGDNGRPLALIDSIEITILRTAAATAAAASRLSRPDSTIAALVGCGSQARAQIRALSRVRPIQKVLALDADTGRARRLAGDLARELGIEAVATEDLDSAVSSSHICITCTPSRRSFLKLEHLHPGLFIAAVGADSHDKQELDPRVLAASSVVVDHLEQCAAIGELHWALQAGLMSRADVHAELADVVAHRRPGRVRPEEVVVFDSTGTALQDAAAAVALYERALAVGAGLRVDIDR